jgi:hypothetical protein
MTTATENSFSKHRADSTSSTLTGRKPAFRIRHKTRSVWQSGRCNEEGRIHDADAFVSGRVGRHPQAIQAERRTAGLPERDAFTVVARGVGSAT